MPCPLAWNSSIAIAKVRDDLCQPGYTFLESGAGLVARTFRSDREIGDSYRGTA
jgi:hypothetical protein